jgi:hypothetical protein
MGPGYWDFDISLLKNVRVSHRFRLQFRAEAFNHANPLVGDKKELAGLQDPIFGIAGGTNPPRNSKSGVKLSFRRLRRRIDAADSTRQPCIGLTLTLDRDLEVLGL